MNYQLIGYPLNHDIANWQERPVLKIHYLLAVLSFFLEAMLLTARLGKLLEVTTYPPS